MKELVHQDVAAALEKTGFSKESLMAARTAHQENGESIAANLLKLDLITLEDLLNRMAQHYKVPFLALEETTRRFFSLVPLNLIQQHRVVPMGLEGRTLSLGMVNPLDVEAADAVAFMTGYEISIVGVLELQFDKFVDDASKAPAETQSVEEMIKGVAEKVKEVGGKIVVQNTATSLSLSDTSDSAIRKFIRSMVTDALTQHVSDIHIEPQETALLLRYRVDGLLKTAHRLPLSTQAMLVSAFKIMANLDITETRRPQDGRISLKLDNRSVDLRIATILTHYGENIVIRILDSKSAKVSMAELGMPDYVHARLKELGQQNTGMILVTGPTGSGKTTTLYSFIQMIRTPTAKIITLEDPIEFPILEGDKSLEGGITQIQINAKVNMTFSAGLRAALRLDPDIVFLGEIRDLETAEIGFSAALTGRLVLSTLHTNDSISTVTRLLDMKIDPFLIAGALKAVMSQRLVRRLCMACRVKYDPPAKTLDRLARSLPREVVMSIVPNLYRPRGCAACGGRGYSGRLGLYELLEVNDEMRALILAHAPLSDIMKAAQQSGLRTMRMAGLVEVLKGRTTLAEVFRVTPNES